MTGDDAERFRTTRWSVVLAAGKKDTPEARRALAELCQTYWYPLYAYVRRRVPDVHEAQDLTQAFFAELLEKNHVGPAAPERGRFRAYLLTAFKHFLSHAWERSRALKRGGGRKFLSLDFEEGESRIRLEPSAGLGAEEMYERQWAVTLLERVMKLLEEEMKAEGKGEQFTILKGHLIGDPAGSTYEAAAARLNTTATAAKMATSRMRGRYRRLLREEIAQTVSAGEDADDEIRELYRTLGG